MFFFIFLLLWVYGIFEQSELITSLRAERLTIENANLKACIAVLEKNSGNSSKPPSSDIVKPPPDFSPPHKRRRKNGNNVQERFWSILTTCKQQGKNFITFLQNSINAALNGLPPPTLIKK